MNALKTARKLLKNHPDTEHSRTLAELVLALESEPAQSQFQLSKLYELDLKTFDLAIEILREWRMERYVSKRAKLFVVSQKVSGSAPAPESDADAAKA